MSRKSASVKLSQFFKGATFAGYCRTIGSKKFYFGKDTSKAEALVRAEAIQAKWNLHRAAKLEEWTSLGLQEAKAIALGASVGGNGAVTLPQDLQPLKTVSSPLPEASTLSLHGAVDLYSSAIRSTAEYSPAWKNQLIWRINEIKRASLDLPLAEVDFDKVSAIVNHFKSRKGILKEKTSVEQSVNLVKSSRLFFNWLEDSGKWKASFNLDKLFKIKRNKLKTNTDRREEDKAIQTFSLESLKVLYSEANEQQKLYMLMALNCGVTQQELSILEREEITEKEGAWIVDHYRGKTGVRGVYNLWPETAALLLARMEKHTPKNQPLALLTQTGQALVTYNLNTKTDSVWATFTKLRQREKCKKVKTLPFKYLRKTGADFIMARYGLEVAQAYLSHTGGSVAERHYVNRSFDKLNEALKDLREWLSPIF
jgi:integrase